MTSLTGSSSCGKASAAWHSSGVFRKQLLMLQRPGSIHACSNSHQDPQSTVKQRHRRRVCSAGVQAAITARHGDYTIRPPHGSRCHQDPSTGGIKTIGCTTSVGAAASHFRPRRVQLHANRFGCRASHVVAGCVSYPNSRHPSSQTVSFSLSRQYSNTTAAAADVRRFTPGKSCNNGRSRPCSCAADGILNLEHPAADGGSRGINAGSCGVSISSGSRSSNGGGSGGDNSGGDGGGGKGGGSGNGTGDQPRFPAWYSVWMWCTALVYLVWRWRWRRNRQLAAEQFEREQQAEEKLQQDWQAFAQKYRSNAAGHQDSHHG